MYTSYFFNALLPIPKTYRTVTSFSLIAAHHFLHHAEFMTNMLAIALLCKKKCCKEIANLKPCLSRYIRHKIACSKIMALSVKKLETQLSFNLIEPE